MWQQQTFSMNKRVSKNIVQCCTLARRLQIQYGQKGQKENQRKKHKRGPQRMRSTFNLQNPKLEI